MEVNGGGEKIINKSIYLLLSEGKKWSEITCEIAWRLVWR